MLLLGCGKNSGPQLGAYDYLISNDADWDDVFALGPITLAGKTIAVAPGNYTTKTIIGFNPASTVRLISSSVGDKPQINELVISGSSNLSLERLRLVSSAWQSDASTTKAACRLTGTIGAITWTGCDFIGNYRGTVNPTTFDFNSDTYPEYACICPIFNDSGVVTGFEIPRPTVGDLMADGTYSMIFTSGQGITFTVAPVASFTVSGGQITGTTLTSGGSSNGTSATSLTGRSALVSWTGQRRMLNWMPRGISSASPETLNGPFVVEDCSFFFFTNAIKPGSIIGPWTVRNNRYDGIYQDFNSFGIVDSQAGPTITFTDNFGTRPFSKDGDPGNPHSDFFQLFMDDIGTTTPSDWSGISHERNIFCDTSSRGGIQGLFHADPPAGIYYSGMRVVGNAIISKGYAWGAYVEAARDGYFYRNTIVRYDPTDTANNLSAVQLAILDCEGSAFVGGNIMEAITTNSDPSVDTGRVANLFLGYNGASVGYGTVFTNHTGSRLTKDQIAAAYTPKAGYTQYGCFGDTAYINHAARTTNRSLEPSYVRFDSWTGQTASSTVTSNWSRVQGGVDGRSISIANGEYRIADDASGTNATAWTSTASTISVGKCVQCRHTTSGSGSTTTTTTLTVGSQSFVFESTTTPSATFTAVDNQGTERSSFNPRVGETGIRKFIFAIRCKPDAIVTNANIIAHTAATVQRLWFPSATLMRYQCISSTRCGLRPPLTPDLTTRTHIIALDFTNTNPNEGCYWATDVDGVLLNGVPGTGGTFDTRTTAGSGSDYGAFVATTNAAAATALFSTTGDIGLFGEADGGGVLFDGRIEFLWMDWGNASYSLPDITDAAVRNKWTADNIGANGQGPTGSIPKVYYTGNAAGWNAGLANLGSLTLPLTKQSAGNYT